MVTIAIIGKSSEKIEQLKQLLPKYNLTYTEKFPDIVISYGGDGMFLIAERMYPNIPKALLRDSQICNNCSNCSPEELLKKISQKEYKVKELVQLKASHKDNNEMRELIGINDIVIRNFFPTEALRFKYKIDNQEYSRELIGDGIVIATPFGSNKGAYYNSITRNIITDQIGIALNNITTPHNHHTIHPTSTIEIIITRGQGVLVADNNRDYINLSKDNTIKIKLHNTTAKILEFNSPVRPNPQF